MSAQPYAGSVYLLHLERPLAAARNQFRAPLSAHYLGWTASRTVSPRVRLHRRGQSGSKYMRAAYAERIGFVLVRTWRDVDRRFERRLKGWHKLAALCPTCVEARSRGPGRRAA